MRSLTMILPFALAALCATASIAQQSDEAPVQSLTVELSSFKFTPATLTLQRGRHYRIHFVNTSSGGHDFVAEKFFEASTIAAEDKDKISDGKIALHGGDAVDIGLVPNQAGTFKSRCSHFMHGMFGMKGKIIVQ